MTLQILNSRFLLEHRYVCVGLGKDKTRAPFYWCSRCWACEHSNRASRWVETNSEQYVEWWSRDSCERTRGCEASKDCETFRSWRISSRYSWIFFRAMMFNWRFTNLFLWRHFCWAATDAIIRVLFRLPALVNSIILRAEESWYILLVEYQKLNVRP